MSNTLFTCCIVIVYFTLSLHYHYLLAVIQYIFVPSLLNSLFFPFCSCQWKLCGHKLLLMGRHHCQVLRLVSKVLSQCSSNNTFLKNAGLSTPSSKSSPAREAALRRQLNAQKQSSPVLHDHLEELKKKTATAEEVLERTASLFDEL